MTTPFFTGWLAEGTGSGTTFTENAAAGYARRAVTLAPLSYGQTALISGVTFNGIAGAFVVTQRALYDAASGGNLLQFWGLMNPVSVVAGGTDTVAAGDLAHVYASLNPVPIGMVSFATGATVGTTSRGLPIIAGVALAVTNGAVSAGVAQQPVIPAGFLWNFAKYPMSIAGNGAGGFLCDFVPEVYHQPALSGTTYFVSPVGSDSNSGLTSYANALASIGHAITLGNAGGVPYCVVVKAGLYYRTQGFFGLIPTQACAFLADGGRVVTGTFDNLTWALVAGTTATYSSSRSNANRMFDILNNDSFGNYNEMTNVSLSAVPTADLAAGSWGTYNNIVYARRSDAAAITSSNSRLMIGNVSILDFTGFFSGQTGVTQNCFIGGTTATSGFDLQGGGAGGIVFTNNATANVMGRNGTTKYTGGILNYSGCKGIRSDNLNGLTAWVNWESSCNADDGFNGHNSNYAVTGYTPQFLTINCRANNNGRGNSTSNNGITAHETCLFIDINGSYDSNYGGNSAFIDNTQAWHIGTSCQRSLGDTARGGTVPPIEFEAQNACRMWLCDTTGFSNPTSGAFAIQTAGTAHVSKHNHTSIIGAESVATGGTIDTY